MQPHYMKRTTRQISHGGPYSDDLAVASLVKKARSMEQFRAYAYADTDNQI